MTQEQRKEFEEIQNQIYVLQEKLKQINPYAGLKMMSNKEFGEQWSESLILSKCPSLSKSADRKGHDLVSSKYGKIEVKSSRLPNKSITYNQCHLDEADYFLFINYDTEEGEEDIYFVPSEDLKNENLFSKSCQHNRDGGCYSIGLTKKNRDSLMNYHYSDFSSFNSFLEKGDELSAKNS